MHETIPIAIGVLIALLCRHVETRRTRDVVSSGLVIVGAATASLVNGEQHAWPLLLGFDLLLVSTGVMAGRIALGWVSHRARPSSL